MESFVEFILQSHLQTQWIPNIVVCSLSYNYIKQYTTLYVTITDVNTSMKYRYLIIKQWVLGITCWIYTSITSTNSVNSKYSCIFSELQLHQKIYYIIRYNYWRQYQYEIQVSDHKTMSSWNHLLNLYFNHIYKLSEF